MTLKRIFILSTMVFFAGGGCVGTQDISTYEQLREASSGTIRAMAKDGTLYELTTFRIMDSALVVTGNAVRQGNRSTFAGELRYSDLLYIQSSRLNVFRGILFCGLLGFAGRWMQEAAHENGLRIWHPSGGGGSCPYVYAWDGAGFVIQGEVFGTAFGKGLETSARCMLPVAKASGKTVQVRLTNERPETHYVNRVQLLGFRTPNGSSVLLDTENRGWPVRDPLPPVESPKELTRRDGIWWTSNLRSTTNGGDFRDGVEFVIPRPRGATSGSLILHIINTQIFNAVYEVVFGYLGDQQLPFLYQLEHDPQLIEILKGWISECGLGVEVWQEGEWHRVGAIVPEASEVPFSRIVRLNAAGVEDETMRVRVTSLADTWKIDAVEVDWSPAAPLSPSVLPLRSARHSVAGPATEDLRMSDAGYSMILPGERIDLEFDALAPEEEQQVSYALEAAGYLYEWMQSAPQTSCVPAMFARYAPDPLTVVHGLLSRREVLLSIIYARWREQRGG